MIVKTFDFSLDAFDVFHLFKDEPRVFFLDSSLLSPLQEQYSFVGFDPFDTVSGNDLPAYEAFKEKFNRWRIVNHQFDLPLTSGAVGYLSYDFGMLLQGIASDKPLDAHMPLFDFAFYDVILIIDHRAQKLHITSSGFPETQVSLQNKRAQERLAMVVDRLRDLKSADACFDVSPKHESIDHSFLQSHVTQLQYREYINRALEHIREGNIYEINLSHKLSVKNINEFSQVKPWQMYARLRSLSPSCYGAFYDGGAYQLISVSPERFLSLRGRTVQIQPMKGTRPRGNNPAEDLQLREDLSNSAKEIAELLMVTDLERNDLGKVCETGSVNVKNLRAIEEYKTVFQATSTVQGVIKAEYDFFDLIDACFPGGSVTGCPKNSAMRIIDDIEIGRRGIYTGALGYMDFGGNLDFNMLIRTILSTRKEISFHVGGGIVADSNWQMEYDETWVKARAMVDCLDQIRN